MFTEVGVNLQSDYMVRYDFDQETGDISTDEETIIIGFATQLKRGLLLQIIGGTPEKPEYISVEMNNNGELYRGKLYVMGNGSILTIAHIIIPILFE